MTDMDPDIEAETERRYNIFYRCIEDESVPFTPDEFELLPHAIDCLTEEETQDLGEVSLAIERQGREGLDFEEVTDKEREYIEILNRGIDRHREQQALDG